MTTTTDEIKLSVYGASQFLGVSVDFIYTEVKAGKLNFSCTDPLPMISLAEIKRYKASVYTARQSTLDELTKESQKLDMGY